MPPKKELELAETLLSPSQAFPHVFTGGTFRAQLENLTFLGPTCNQNCAQLEAMISLEIASWVQVQVETFLTFFDPIGNHELTGGQLETMMSPRRGGGGGASSRSRLPGPNLKFIAGPFEAQLGRGLLGPRLKSLSHQGLLGPNLKLLTSPEGLSWTQLATIILP